MNRSRSSLAAMLAAVALALFALPNAFAVCGVPRSAVTPAGFHSLLGQPHLLSASYEPFEEQGIVGF